MTRTRCSLPAPSFSPPSCSFSSSPSPPSNYCPFLAARPRSGSPASSSFRPLCCAPMPTRIGSRAIRNGSLHLILLAVAFALRRFWAFGAIDLSGGPEHPVATIFLALSLWIGLPFLALGATSPLLQFWWSRVEGGGIPYRLFALSNLASLLALGLYPTLIEPNFTLHAQRVAWFFGFAALRVAGRNPHAALRVRPRNPPLPSQHADAVSLPASPLAHKLLWVLLPMGASMQLSDCHQLHHGQHRPHPAALDSPPRRLPAHHHPRFRVSAPAAARHRRAPSRRHARRPGLHALPGRCLAAPAHRRSLLPRRTLRRRPLLPQRGLRASSAARLGIHALLSALCRRRRARFFPRRARLPVPVLASTTISPSPSSSPRCWLWPAGGAAAGRCACSGPSPAS